MNILDSFYHWWVVEDHQNRFDAVFFDIDGTLQVRGRPIAGATRLLEQLRQVRKPFKLITNDGNHSLTEKSAFMAQAGLPVAEREIVSCSEALADVAAEHGFSGERLFVMGDLGKPLDYATLAGLRRETDPDRLDSCVGVIVGEGQYDWQKIFHRVLNYLIRRRGTAFLVVPNPDSFWPDGHGGFGIGAGAVARFLTGILREQGFDQRILFLGKPYPALFRCALREIVEDFNLPAEPPPDRVLVLGDYPPSDIRGANRCGMAAALMLTGVTREEQLATACPDADRTPAYVFRRLV